MSFLIKVTDGYSVRDSVVINNDADLKLFFYKYGYDVRPHGFMKRFARAADVVLSSDFESVIANFEEPVNVLERENDDKEK